MKRQAIKWIIAASAIIFLISGTAWADGKGNRGGHNKGGKGNGYHSAPQHSGGHGHKGYQKRPPLGKYPGHRVHRAPNHAHKRPHHNYGHYRHHRRPQHGRGFHAPHHHQYRPRAKAVRVKNTDIHRGVAMSLLTANPIFALDAIINHR